MARKLTKAEITELEELAGQLKLAKERSAKAAAEETALAEKIRLVAAKGALPIVDGKSQFLNLGDGTSLRLTQGDASIKLEPEELRGRIGDDNFHRVCKITTASFDPAAWKLLLSMELVKESDLKDSIKEGDPPRRIVAFGPPHKATS